MNEIKWTLIFVFGLGGALFSLYSPALIPNNLPKRHTILFGKIPIWLIGTVGYVLIMATAAGGFGTKMWPDTLVVVNHALIVFALLFSTYLIFKATREHIRIGEVVFIPWSISWILFVVIVTLNF